tara:strand:+ start:2321 stop:2557 length:237 start_codon:yes stop_codon:yes gene_type:complete
MKTKGATSHIDVRLGDLCNMLSPEANVRVSRSWARAIGITDGIKPIRREPTKPLAVQVEEPKEEPQAEHKLDVEVDNW